MKSLAKALEQKCDNFLLLRFVAASLVIYGHAPAISGGFSPPDLFVRLGWGDYSGAIAVNIFFIISGFLVTGSYLRRQNVVDFVWARLLRILPGYITCLVLCAFLLGLFFSTSTLTEYLSARGPYEYVWRNLTLKPETMTWHLAGVFEGDPKRAVVNGSIWTLPAEVRMYGWVALLGIMGIIKRRWLFNIVVFGLVIYGYLRPHDIPLVPHETFVRLAALFAIGAFCYVNRGWIPVHGGLLLAAITLAWFARTTLLYPLFFALSETLFAFWFAYNTRWFGFNRFGDYSYGIYLWGYPIQQCIAALYPDLPTLTNALFGLLGALAIGIASWHLVEKPALCLKRFVCADAAPAPRAPMGAAASVSNGPDAAAELAF